MITRLYFENQLCSRPITSPSGITGGAVRIALGDPGETCLPFGVTHFNLDVRRTFEHVINVHSDPRELSCVDTEIVSSIENNLLCPAMPVAVY